MVEESPVIRVRGHGVSFVKNDGRRPRLPAPWERNDEGRWQLDCPAEMILVHDSSGQLLRSCSAHVVFRGGDLKKSLMVIGDGKKALRAKSTLDIPKGPWDKACYIDAIWYTRTGEKRREHLYQFPQPLFVCADPFAFRVVLPEGCDWGEAGFGWP